MTPKSGEMSDTTVNSLEVPLVLKHVKNRSSLKDRDVRIMSKRGRINLHLNKIPDKSVRYARDLFNTLVNMRWRWIIILVIALNIFAYCFIGTLFWLDAWYTGDFDDKDNHRVCIRGVHKFTSFFMLGIETITTTGYGYFHPTEFCNFVFAIMTFSTLVTIIIDGAFISVVYVKFGRPSHKESNYIFSRKAVITLRNGKMCLIIRLNDKNGKHWIDSKINLFLVRERVVDNMEFVHNYVEELSIKPLGAIFWPVEIVHEIDSSSPLWTYSPEDIISKRIEILAIISGCSTQTGQPSRSQTSYLSKEILWGYRFEDCLEFNHVKGEYYVNNKNFNETREFDAPLCSPQMLEIMYRDSIDSSLA